MNGKFEKKYTLRISDYSCYDYLMPHAVLDLFQDVAGEHADSLGIGFEDLIKKDLIWVLVRTKFTVKKYPPEYASVRVVTWPKKKGRIDFDREYLICDEAGNTLIEGISKWVIVNVKTRRISTARDIEYNCELCTDENFPGNYTKLPDLDISGCEEYAAKAAFTDLDHNMHVNNISYAKYIMNAVKLSRNETIGSFEIDYIKELQPDSAVTLHIKREDGCILIKGILEGGESCFAAKIGLIHSGDC